MELEVRDFVRRILNKDTPKGFDSDDFTFDQLEQWENTIPDYLVLTLEELTPDTDYAIKHIQTGGYSGQTLVIVDDNAKINWT